MFEQSVEGAAAPAESTTPPIVEGEQSEATPQAVQTPESEAQSTADKAKPPVDPVQKRIDQITWQRHEAERRLNGEILRRQQIETELQQLRRQQQEFMRQATLPRPEQFGMDPEQYRRAVEQHSQQFIEQRQREMEEQQRVQREQQAQEHFQRVMTTRIAEAMEKYPDFEEVVGNPQLPPLRTANPPLFAALMEHEQMAELTYYLGKHPADAHRISALPPTRAILEMGKIAARISAAPARQVSTAPAPPAQVGNSAPADTSPSDKDDVDTWRRKREAQLRKRGDR